MKGERLYHCAGFALKPDPKVDARVTERGLSWQSPPAEWGSLDVNTESALWLGILFATSREEAEAEMLRATIEQYPPAEGWTLHKAYVEETPADMILEAAALIEAEMREKLEGEKPDYEM